MAHLSMSQCCDAIILAQTHKALNYAVNYAIAGRDMTGAMVRVQALYILNNMTQWRGDTAKAVRESLKAISKAK